MHTQTTTSLKEQEPGAPSFAHLLHAKGGVSGSGDRQGRTNTAPATISATRAVEALIQEARLTPKPALVDQRGSGAHHDLSLPLMIASAHTLKPYFEAMAEAAQHTPIGLTLREQLGALGREAEAAMLATTQGINTHRGAIWSLGLLIAAHAHRPGAPSFAVSSRRVGRTPPVDRTNSIRPTLSMKPKGWGTPASSCSNESSTNEVCRIAAQIAALPDRHAPAVSSHGAAARMRYGVQGARGEAVAGFPHIRLHGLPALHAARSTGMSRATSKATSPVSHHGPSPDTCLLHRGGEPALHAAQRGARAVLDAGGCATATGMAALHTLDATLLGLWASPGGSADLLAATLFLDLIHGDQA